MIQTCVFQLVNGAQGPAAVDLTFHACPVTVANLNARGVYGAQQSQALRTSQSHAVRERGAHDGVAAAQQRAHQRLHRARARGRRAAARAAEPPAARKLARQQPDQPVQQTVSTLRAGTPDSSPN